MFNRAKSILHFVCLIMTSFIPLAYAIDVPQMASLDIPKYFYSIQYPVGWTHQDHGKGLVVFKGKTLDEKSGVLVNIQTIATKKNHGHYVDVKALMDDFYQQVPMHTEKASFGERQPITLVSAEGETLHGEQTTVTFYEEGKLIKHWQVMFMNPDGMLFQTWAYRTQETEFDANHPLAEEMLSSWKIK